MQLLYDAMFENMITGLPIARAMVKPVLQQQMKRQEANFVMKPITDHLDRSLFTSEVGQSLMSMQVLGEDANIPRTDPSPARSTWSGRICWWPLNWISRTELTDLGWYIYRILTHGSP